MSSLHISLPDSIRERLESLARKDGVSVDAFAASVLAQRVAVAEADSYVRRRADRGNAGRLLEILSQAPEIDPEPHDRLESPVTNHRMNKASALTKIRAIRETLDTFDLSKAGEPQKGDEIHRECLRLQVLVENIHADALKPLPGEIKQVVEMLAVFEHQVTSAAMGRSFSNTTSQHEWMEQAQATLTKIEDCISALSEG